MDVKVIGIDPSFRNVGLALGSYNLKSNALLIADVRLIKTAAEKSKTIRKNSDDLRCAQEIYKGLCEIIEGQAARFAFVEVPSGTQSARASWALGITVGILGALPSLIVQLTPRQVKLGTVGTTTASKREMIAWAMENYPHVDWAMRTLKGKRVSIDSKNEHMADACAALHVGVKSEQWAEITAGVRSVL